MKQNKLCQILKTFRSEEWKLLRRVVLSPLYNTNPSVIALFELLRKQAPKLDSSPKGKTRLFAKLFPNEEYNDVKMRRLFSELTKITEHFLVHLQLEKQTVRRGQLLSEAYGERNLYPLFEKSTKKLLTDLETSPYRDMSYYLNRVQLNEALYFHPMKDKYDMKDSTLEDLTESLDKYFVLAKMRFGIAMRTVERVFAKKYQLRFTEAVENEAVFDKEAVLFQLYQLSFKLLTEQEEQYFEEIERLFFEHFEALNSEAKRLLFFNAMNFINQKLNEKRREFDTKAFEWSKFGLINDLFLENGKISQIVFGNIVLYGCRVNQFEWTYHFIEDYKSKLEPETRDDAVTYNLGVLSFYQEDYDKAISILRNFPFSSSYILRSRLFIIRILFKLFLKNNDYHDHLIYNIQSFESYLIKNKYFSKGKLEPHLNFIRLIRKLSNKIINNQSKNSIREWLRTELKSSKKIGGKGWLVEMIEEIRKK